MAQIEKISTYVEDVENSLHNGQFLDFVEMHKDGPHNRHEGFPCPHAAEHFTCQELHLYQYEIPFMIKTIQNEDFERLYPLHLNLTYRELEVLGS